jgi:hypothetical protein
MTDHTIRRDRLATLDTAALIGQYNLAISRPWGRHSNTMPGQKRINYIVDLLSARADAGDPIALRWYAAT